jgi:transposase
MSPENVDPTSLDAEEELPRIAIIAEAVAGRITVSQAAARLHLSPRQVKRLKHGYRSGDLEWVARGNRGRPKPWRTPDDVRARILAVRTDLNGASNDSELWRRINEEGIAISRETVRRILRSAGFTATRGPGRPRRVPQP